jgi:uncharacterized protein
MLSACYEVITGREPDMLRAYLLAVLVQMIAIHLLAEFGYVNLNMPPYFGMATLLAGFVFGLGMTLAIGCAGAVFYRASEGRIDYLYVVAAFTLSVWFSNDWLVEPIRNFFTDRGIAISVHNALTIDRLLIIAIFAVTALLWVIRGKVRPYKDGWKWSTTGLCLGLIGALAWTVQAASGKTYGLGAMQGSDSLATLLLEWDLTALNGSLLMVLGIPLGSFMAYKKCGRSMERTHPGLKKIIKSVVGGSMMGVSAAVALGDSIFHGLSGTPALAVSSLGFMVCVFVGAWVGIKLKWL